MKINLKLIQKGTLLIGETKGMIVEFIKPTYVGVEDVFTGKVINGVDEDFEIGEIFHSFNIRGFKLLT